MKLLIKNQEKKLIKKDTNYINNINNINKTNNTNSTNFPANLNDLEGKSNENENNNIISTQKNLH